MAQLPDPLQSIAAKIYRAYLQRQQLADNPPDEADDDEASAEGSALRSHLGASIIGHQCSRYVWMSWRWIRSNSFGGRMLRLLETGQIMEARMADNLRAIGCELHTAGPDGAQFRVRAHGGHFGGGMDGAIRNVPEAPVAWHVWENKTHGDKSFRELVAAGVVKAKPQHEAQMQVYMGLSGMDRALYTATNKNTDAIHSERIAFDSQRFAELMQRARSIIENPEPPPRVEVDPMRWPCTTCPMTAWCHGEQVPRVSCRTCAHSTPRLDGANGEWLCERHGQDIPDAFQRTGCDAHRFIPALLDNWAEYVDGDDADNWIRYRLKANGAEFVNGPPPHGVTSEEIVAAMQNKAALADPDVMAVRKEFDARIVSTSDRPEGANGAA
jgi:PD-(D/E)XK nuclease superfamily